MTRLTDKELAEIRARLEAGPPGPWYQCVDMDGVEVTSIPRLFAEIDRLRAENDRLKQTVCDLSKRLIKACGLAE